MPIVAAYTVEVYPSAHVHYALPCHGALSVGIVVPAEVTVTCDIPKHYSREIERD